jgi:DNA polymerase III subunit beta
VNVTLPVAEFKAALTQAKPFIDRNAYLPALGCAKITAQDGALTVTTTDLDCTVTVTVAARVAAAGAELVPFKSLFATMPKGKGKGELELRSGDGDMHVTNGHVSTLRTVPLADYPLTGAARIPAAGEVTVRSYELDPAVLGLVVPAAATESTRPILSGVYFTKGQIAATDSYRLHVADVDIDYPNVLIPGALAAQIVKAGRLARMDVSTTTDPAGRERVAGIAITAGNIAWWTAGIDGEFPNYRQLIPAGYPTHVVCDRPALAEAVGHVKSVVRDATTPVRLHLFGDRIDLEVITQDVGVAKATVAARLSGGGYSKWLSSRDPMTVAFNPGYLLGCLAAGTTPEVNIGLVDSLKPSLLADVDPTGPACRRILMPVRIG